MDVRHKAPKRIKELVDQFDRNLSSYKSSGYKEGQLREEFINPFFEALGWDIANVKGAAPANRDVIHYDSLKIAGGTKAPDYCFTLTGRRKFFVETKKPSINIKKDSKSAHQLRRYAWSAKLTLSILTNFEDLIVYESRQRPHVGDKPDVEKVRTISYTEYIDKWDEIHSTFSYEAVLQGSFDKYSETVKKKRGTKEVDNEFLEEIEKWREKLAKNIALLNPNLNIRELNYCVQRTIDRIVFLRMCEDRGIATSIEYKKDVLEDLIKTISKEKSGTVDSTKVNKALSKAIVTYCYLAIKPDKTKMINTMELCIKIRHKIVHKVAQIKLERWQTIAFMLAIVQFCAIVQEIYNIKIKK